MTDELELGSVTHLAVVLGWVTGAVVTGYLLGWGVSWILQRVGRRSDLLRELANRTRRSLRATLMAIAAQVAVSAAVPASAPWRGVLEHALRIAVIAAIGWLAVSHVLVVERRAIARFAGGATGPAGADRHRRRIRTQVGTLRRLTVAVVVVLTGAAALMTFPEFKQLGTTLFASAGVLSVVAGLAAQTTFGSVFAGMQISFSDVIRVGDTVVLEGELGRVEEITLTYVVVEIWDQRRLVLPTTYFTTTPVETWTRHGSDLLGTVYLEVDFTVPLAPLRAELDRLLSESDSWDGRSGGLVVTDAVGGYLQLRATVSAPDSSALWNLRCHVREGLVDWLQCNHPAALPRWRVERGADTRRPDGFVGAGHRTAAE